MGYGITNEAYYPAIATAIRSKAGTSSTYSPSEMASAIEAIEAGGGGDVVSLVARTLTEFSNNDVTTVGNSAFTDCRALVSVYLPACTTVGNYAFAVCSALTTVDLPACTSIGDNAFIACSALTSINLPACETVCYGAFNSCSHLQSVYLPACTTVSRDAFRDCSRLASVDLPACTTVSSYAFSYCTSLTTVSLPVCTTIGDNAFYDCHNLVSLYLDGVSSVTVLDGINVFAGSPLGWYSASAGRYGSVYVPASLVDAFKTAPRWSDISSCIVGV